MKRKIVFSLIVFIMFIVFPKNYVFAEGTCKCATKETLTGGVKILSCEQVEVENKCANGTQFSCIIDGSTNNGGIGAGCATGNACECKSTSGQTGQSTGSEEPVTLPGYPTQDANQKPLTGLLTNQNLTLGTIIGKALTYIYVIAGIALLLVLIMGGISLMTAAGDPKKIEAGYGKIKDALIGFLIIFVSYIATQLVEVVLGVKIL